MLTKEKSVMRMLLIVCVFLAMFVFNKRTLAQEQNANPPTRPVIDLKNFPVIKHLWYGIDTLDIKRGIPKKTDIELSAYLASRHMWHGFDLLDDHGVFIPSGTVTFGNTGFSAKVIGAYCLSSGFEKSDELNYAAFYTGAFLQDTPYVTNYTANYFYYGKPKQHARRHDSQEIGIAFAWPKLVADKGLVPNYYFGAIWPTESHSNLGACQGFIHVFGLAHDFDIPDFWSGGEKQTFRIFGDVTFNDGFGGVKHDWSHAVVGLSTNVKLGKLTMTPSLCLQKSMDDSVNKEDELWCGVNLAYRF